MFPKFTLSANLAEKINIPHHSDNHCHCIGRVLRYFERVFVATFFSFVAEIDSIWLFVASCQKLFVAGCQMTFIFQKHKFPTKSNCCMLRLRFF